MQSLFRKENYLLKVKAFIKDQLMDLLYFVAQKGLQWFSPEVHARMATLQMKQHITRLSTIGSKCNKPLPNLQVSNKMLANFIFDDSY